MKDDNFISHHLINHFRVEYEPRIVENYHFIIKKLTRESKTNIVDFFVVHRNEYLKKRIIDEHHPKIRKR